MNRAIARRRIDDQIVGDLAGDRRAVFGRDRRTQDQPVVARRRGDVGGPRRPQQGEAAAEQEAVTRLRRRLGIIAERGVVELAQNRDIAAVVDLVEQRAVAARGVDRAQHQEFGAELDQATVVAGRQLEIGDRRIGGGVRIEREEGAPAQLFIGADDTELGAGREGLAAHDLKPLDSGRRRRTDIGRGQKQQWCGDEQGGA